MMKNFKIQVAASMLLLTMLVANIGPMFAATSPFSDVPTNFWAYEQINRCVQDGIVSGYDDGTFKPGNPVSYGAFSIMLARAFYADELAGYSSQSTATGEAIMNAHGILKGTSRSSASIGAPLPREDMAQCMYNVLVDKGAKIPSSNEYSKAISSISDYSTISGNCCRGVLVCYTLGLLGGQSDGSFGPKNPMNRAQGCVVINRLRDYFQNSGENTNPVEPPIAPPVDPPVVPELPETPTTPVEPPVTTELPEFKMMGGEDIQTAMSRIMANVTYTPGYLSNGKPITEENIKELLASVEQSMPTGTEWNEDERYSYRGGCGWGGACNGWAYALSDYLFTKSAPLTKHQNFSQLKVGDVVYMKNSANGYSHVFVVTSLEPPAGRPSTYFQNCSGNVSGEVDWKGDGNRETFKLPEVASGTWIYSRY